MRLLVSLMLVSCGAFARAPRVHFSVIGPDSGAWPQILSSIGFVRQDSDLARVFVLRAAPQFECLATNSIGGEPMNASLAVSDGTIFIRTDEALWCIARDRPREH